MMFASLPSALGHIQGKRLRAVALAGKQRARMLPNVQTTTEAGLPELDATTWYGALFPAKVPPEVVRRMNHEINKIIKDPEMAQRFQSMGYELSGSTPQELGAHLKE
jgi:tripartite-type tricarboxylate transporter receptor subunit TctC